MSSPKTTLLPSPLPDDDNISTRSQPQNPQDESSGPSHTTLRNLSGFGDHAVHSPIPPLTTTASIPNQDDETYEDLNADYVEPDPESLLPPPNFSPFFTLVEDATTGEYHH